jgi:hypothetical protein
MSIVYAPGVNVKRLVDGHSVVADLYALGSLVAVLAGTLGVVLAQQHRLVSQLGIFLDSSLKPPDELFD